MTIYSFNLNNSDLKNLNKISVNERVRHLHCFKKYRISKRNSVIEVAIDATSIIIINN